MRAKERSALEYLYDHYSGALYGVVFRIMKKESVAEEVLQDVFLKIDGKPVDAGIFDRNTAGLIKMKEIGKGAIKFAVTIEPRGGKTSPTLETMQVAGNVGKS